LLVLFALNLLACGGTQLRRTWSDPTAEGRLVGKIAVVGFSPHREVRETFEEILVEALRARGNDVVASHTLSGDRPDASRAGLEALVSRERLGAVLTAKAIYVDASEEVVVGGENYRPQLDGDLYAYALRTNRLLPPEGVVAPQDPFVHIEARLFETGSAQLIWAGITRSENEGDVAKLARDFGKTAVLQLSAKGFIE
jgi:hypothetical protein